MTDSPVAALYLRSAAENPAAIVDQRRRCTLHASAQGWTVGDVFVDDGVSGLRDDRPGLGALRECIASGQVQVVLATERARIARDPAIIDDLGRFCDLHHVRLVYVDGPVLGPCSTMQRLFREEVLLRALRGDDMENEELLR